jgi:hypothetical protein
MRREEVGRAIAQHFRIFISNPLTRENRGVTVTASGYRKIDADHRENAFASMSLGSPDI